VNGLDIAIALAAIGAFVGGYRRGLVVRASSFIGLFLGVALVGQNLASLLDLTGPPPQSRRVFYIAVLLLAGALLGRGLGLFFGRWLRGRMPTQTLRKADRLGGGALGLVGVVATVWIMVPIMAHIPGWPAESSRASAIGRAADKRLPTPPDLLGSVRRLTKGGRFPVVISALQRSLDGGLPPVEAPLDLTTQSLVEESVVEVSANTCGVLSDGSGFSVGNGQVVTNAHVVTGASSVSVVDDAGVSHSAKVEFLEPSRDLALLSVDGYKATALSFGVPDLGEEVGVFGHPVGGALRVAPAGVREMLDAVGRDIYDKKRTLRPVIVLSGSLEPGDSGAAVVARSGRLIGVAFAVAPDRSHTAYAVPVSELKAFLDEAATSLGHGVPGRCLN
jgi:uncharacterized membrane protein required for colicin V production